MKYKNVTEGEWVQPVMRGYKMMCCDCGAVHILNFRIEGDSVQLQAFKDNRRTALSRRTKNEKLKQLIKK
ncbi:MAG TPA: hypothetical protein VLH77_00910 [Gammaproteobacteria bacterium]|nr:hypothetical protein [Gammaproteobacteria bacterium]